MPTQELLIHVFLVPLQFALLVLGSWHVFDCLLVRLLGGGRY